MTRKFNSSERTALRAVGVHDYCFLHATKDFEDFITSYQLNLLSDERKQEAYHLYSCGFEFAKQRNNAEQ